MKILHLTQSDTGGAGIAAMRLNRALLASGIDSRLLVSSKAKPDSDALRLPLWRSAGDRIKSSVEWHFLSCAGLNSNVPRSYNILPSFLHRLLNNSDADIINLHWVNRELISIAELAKIRKPVVWTFHDMWPFCGAEHHAENQLYVSGYRGIEKHQKNRQCLRDRSLRKTLRMEKLDGWVYQRKQKHWHNWRPYVVTPSTWLASCVQRSALMRNLPVTVIPNCLDLEVFKPMPAEEARERLGFSKDNKLVLFGACNPRSNLKGGDLLEPALRSLKEGNIEVVVFGAGSGPQIAGFKTHWMGTVSEESYLALLYNAADLTIVPSRQDNLPNTVAESLSCGTPVVAFNIGGIPDMVSHKFNGYLARAYDPQDLGKGMEWVLEAQDRLNIRGNARQSAVETYSESQVAANYMHVYENLASAVRC